MRWTSIDDIDPALYAHIQIPIVDEPAWLVLDTTEAE